MTQRESLSLSAISETRAHSLIFEAYGKGRNLVPTRTTAEDAAELPIDSFFSQPDVDYIIVRDRDAGCFDCVITRA